MKIRDINNKIVKVNVRQDKYPIKEDSRSSIQHLTGQVLRERFPRQVILEDFTIPGCRLSVDFFLPQKGIVVEVQGRQHSEQVDFFHGDRKSGSVKFGYQKHRDVKKCQWVENNKFLFIEILEGTKHDDIAKIIRSYT